MDNYTIYHLHSDLSNCVTNVDSVTKYHQYIARAKECGMTAMGFAEHGSIMEWFHKKSDIEAAGMKYIHAVEAYVTETLDEKIRDNMHCVLIAKNYDGFLELNRLVSESFNRNDNHFYYVPRISMQSLFSTSPNILITSACVGGILGKGNDEVQSNFIHFIAQNQDRCFLEIGHHIDPKQVEYNRKLYTISQQTGVRLIAGTDTHALNEEHEKGRSILQRSKNVVFEGEDRWDLKFKTFDELVAAYDYQGSLPRDVYMSAIEMTNVMADMIEPFDLDKGTKYPHIYENPEETFRQKIADAVERHPYALKNHSREELQPVLDNEIAIYKSTGSIDFMLLQTYIREWEEKNGVQSGYGRGSVSGSMVAYILGITQMDSMRFGLNFFRFMNPSRVTNADIDSDYSGADRDKVKQFLLRDKMNLTNIKTAEIITFNTIAMRGAVRDVCKALFKKDGDSTEKGAGKPEYLKIADYICSKVDDHEDEVRKEYPQVFEYVDIVNGTIVSIGTHPSGVLVSDLPIEESVGLCSISSSNYPVSMLNMKELDALMYVKLDILGLDNLGVINDTCKSLGIERLTPDNTDLDDMDVWRSIRDDTTLIFQWESNSAQAYIKKFMSEKTLEIARKKIPNFSMMTWMSFGNGLIRPACASFRDSVANGEFYDNGFEELNQILAPEAGRIAMQETIMKFLVQFCGYSDAESDTVRRAIAKKYGTEKLLPEIERRFIEYSSTHYDISVERCAEVIKPFMQIILDASAYGFSWNHSQPYSATGYICGYLRYYYPLEFLTAALNTFSDNSDKTAEITKYAQKVGIQITMPKWSISRSVYSYSKERNVIAKGMSSIKYMSNAIGKELYDLSKQKQYTSFMELLKDISDKTSLDTRQLDILVKIDFFSDFGNQRELIQMIDLFERFKKGEAKKIKKSEVDGTPLESIVQKYAIGTTKGGTAAKSYTLLDVMAILKDLEKLVLSMNMKDLSDVIKVKNFADVMGYAGYVSGKNEDRPKLYISALYPVCRRRDGYQFGYGAVTKSIGSGKESRFTVPNAVFNKEPIKVGDVIYCRGYTKDGPYFRMTAYEKLY